MNSEQSGRRGAAWRRPSLLAAVPLAVAAMLATPGDAQAHATQSDCHRQDAQVALSPGQGVQYRVAGWLCQPRQHTSTVQLVLAGFTYDHTYWDAPGVSGSYLRAALASGTAVYTVDRVGVGLSDRPPAELVTAQSEAYVTHQLVQMLRRGPDRFRQVVGVGHSFGSAIWMIEAAEQHDVDALVLTGYLHTPNPQQQTAIAAALYPAAQDPAFRSTGTPDGYVTTIPGARGGAFYYLPGAAPDAVTHDEQFKATGTTGERQTLNLARDPSYSQRITVPVLLVVGDHDALACSSAAGLSCASPAAVCARERPLYPAAKSLSAAVIPEAGHSINGHRSAPIEYALASAWIRAAMSTPRPWWPACRS